LAKFHQDSHFISFAQSLQAVICSYGDRSNEDFTQRQKESVENLIRLEKKFKKILQEDCRGYLAYKKFIEFIWKSGKDNKRNTLAARPYFRERQEKFSKGISSAIQKRRHKSLYKFNVNYTFIAFVLNSYPWAEKSRVRKAALEVFKAREEIIQLNMPLAISRARIFRQKTPESHLSYMDFVQISMEGLINAVDKFVLPYTPVFRSVIIGRIVGDLIENYSMDRNTILYPYGQEPKIIEDFRPGDEILCINNIGKVEKTQVVALHDHGMVEGYEVTFDDGYQVICSAAHKFLTEYGMVSLREIASQELEVFCEPAEQKGWMDSSLRSNLLCKEGIPKSQETVSGMQGKNKAGKNRSCPGDGAEQSKPQWMDELLWNLFSETKNALGTPKDMPPMSKHNNEEFERESLSLETRKSRNCEFAHGSCQRSFRSTEEGQSSNGRGLQKKDSSSPEEVLGGKPGRGLFKHKESMVCSETLKNGEVDEGEWNSYLGGCANSMWKGSKTGRFCISRPQDLGRGRWEFPFSRDFRKKAKVVKYPIKRRYVKKGMSLAPRRNVNSISNDLFFGQGGNENSVVRMVHKYAPLASTGDLVCRRIVRIRPVGLRRMYDLEVSHPKHNFLLPNGVVTSNSDTVIHFYPSDKRKIYRANKAQKHQKEVNFDALADAVNGGIRLENPTNSSEIQHLTSASSLFSLDSPTPESSFKENGGETLSASYAAGDDARPDVKVEQEQILNRLYEVLGNLTIFDKKFVRMKGISLE
jgi:stalled ribosome alternative rescue factor ArfA